MSAPRSARGSRAAVLAAVTASAAAASVAPAQTVASITLGGVVAQHGAKFASLGWEAQVCLNEYLVPGALTDARFVRAASGLAPATVRIGGITGDWLRYVSSSPAFPLPSPPTAGYWPSAPENFTYAQFDTMLGFFAATNLSLMFMLSELYGRNCSAPVPGCASCAPNWCVGDWDTSNVRAFVQHIHDAGLFIPGGTGPLASFELGNELVGHLPADVNVADITQMAAILDAVWADTPDALRPSLYAPSTDACSPAQLEIMANITRLARVKGFSYHAYPGESGLGPDALPSILLNSTWLRSEILRASGSYLCLDAWNAGPRAAGLELLVTESSSSWNLPLPAPAQNSFLNGFFTIAELGQYAQTGVSLVARWAFAEPSPFGTLIYNATAAQWDAAHDYFLLAAYKRVVGGAVLAASGDAATDALVYAYCGQARNGSVVITASNPGTADVGLAFAVPAAPRLEYVFTAPGGNLSATTPILNGDAAAPLRLAADGSMPAMPAAYVAAGATVTVPARSQALFVLLDAALPACM